ncbi:hypothetical protein J0895_07420 [Phormidium pseudopriestleyi FRX01]|uniref:Uncharacterized protein n=1 Tax=Phormidium pseudopriestleyi FRX01 TaxID=1759528 RepID=A0ABS3FPX1_9CYAN|nr:hypothetical protein [Phormidium pseudopriestleyi]MBO0348932.1 hypothetical protein [Phormidium pseudopriestleyi FRX01]
MVIRLTINFSDGSLPLARGGLGWGLHDVAIATSRTQRRRSHVTPTLHPPIVTCDRTSL